MHAFCSSIKRTTLFRGLFYVLGLMVLALGLSLNAKLSLGVSPIVSVAFSIATIWHHNFANITLALYCVFVVAEMVIHLIQARQGTLTQSLRRRLVLDILQFPLSLVFTRFMNVYTLVLPEFATDCAGTFWGGLPGRILLLLVAIVCTGVGAAMTLDVRLIPNPGDGIVQAIADLVRHPVGITKNCVDLCNVCFTVCLSMIAAGQLVGVGLGTVCAMIGVGRIIGIFNHFCLAPIQRLSGLSTPSAKN